MNFKLRLSPEARLRLERERKERLRLFGLADRWLANELMRLMRIARTEQPEVHRDDPTYNASLLYYLVPELARRLGETRIAVQDIDWELRALDNHALRLRIGVLLMHVVSWVGGEASQRLCAEACHGNPLVYAIDRLCPGRLDDAEDLLTRRLAEVAHIRRLTYTGVWSPDFVRD